MTKIIEKNTTIPTKAQQVFSTAENNQPAVTVHVLQGERDQAAHNKTLARFDLTGLPPAPRGTPQIEVAFDIDANGILHVSAKDKATGKEQRIQITASSGLTEAEIQQMVRDAEAHREEDKRFHALVDARNAGDNLAFQAEKSLTELGDKLDAAEKAKIEEALKALRAVLQSDDQDAIVAKTAALATAAHAMAEKLYASAAAGQPGAADAQGGSDAPDRKTEGDVVDAEFTEVKDEGK